MSPKIHVLVCVQNRPLGHPRGSCQARGGPSVYQTFVDELRERGLRDAYRLTNTGCLGPCEGGANVVIYPDGVLYGRVSVRDVPSIIDEHLLAGAVIERLAIAW